MVLRRAVKRTLLVTWTIFCLLLMLPAVLFGGGFVAYLLLEGPIRLVAVVVGINTGPFDRLWLP